MPFSIRHVSEYHHGDVVDETVTVVTVNWFSSAAIKRLTRNLVEKASRPSAIRIVVVDNTGGMDSELSSGWTAPVRPEIVLLRQRGLRGSWAHAYALDHATATVQTKFTLVCDPDVHVFRSGWDNVLVSALDASGAIAIGAPYPPWKLGKYHEFPSPVFAFFRTAAYRALGGCWRPRPASWVRRGYDFFARQVLRAGSIATRRRLLRSPRFFRLARRLESRLGMCGPDTGWSFARSAFRTGDQALLFEVLIPSGLRRVSSDDPVQGLAREFELFQFRKDLFLTHQYSNNCKLWRSERGEDARYWAECIAAVEKTQGVALSAGRSCVTVPDWLSSRPRS